MNAPVSIARNLATNPAYRISQHQRWSYGIEHRHDWKIAQPH